MKPTTGLSTSAGSGITLVPNPYTTIGTIAVDTTVIQARVNGTCASGNAIRVINADGSVTCQAATGGGTVTSIATGSGLTGGNPTAITTSGTIAIDTAVVPRLGASNTFTSPQTVDTTSHGNAAFLGANAAVDDGSSGVFGFASSSSGLTYGGAFRTNSDGGRAIYGEATAVTGGTAGGLFVSRSQSGWGVFGLGSSNTGTNYGGYFQSNGDTGYGVYGLANDTSGGVNYGVLGETKSSSGYGVYSIGNAQVQGDLSYSGSLTQASSRRFKSNIQPMQGALAKVERLRGVTFDWKETSKHDIGLIAEEVGVVVPEVVVYEANGVDAKGVDYGRLTAVLIEAVKEQQAQNRRKDEQIEQLKEQIGRQQAQMIELRGEMTAFRAALEQSSGLAVASASR